MGDVVGGKFGAMAAGKSDRARFLLCLGGRACPGALDGQDVLVFWWGGGLLAEQGIRDGVGDILLGSRVLQSRPWSRMASSGKRSMIVAGCGDKVGVSRFSQAKEMVVSPGYFQISTVSSQLLWSKIGFWACLCVVQ